MITIEALCGRVSGLNPSEIERWVDNHWVRPDGVSGHYMFCEIDEARVRLIRDLRDDMGVHEEHISLILSLVDQLYSARRQINYLRRAITTDDLPELKSMLRGLLEK
ncbi:chaperone modulator CbpM [Entomobacter blattae]|uniref:Chaperone modulatory protein CbpM n=1 Tax=Entomobacter blattae TaxID=2762277 RepID=A0A7H1NQJ5_9PROT|nr:chaperone modulator CbpM [Entomobacter blattae]QNT78055.1 hypothetical protein JGUZn3_08220 [Entomobacter blattae]